MPKKTKKRAKKPLFVAYYRISTKKQNKDMATQKTAVKNYLQNQWPPVKSFTERESGKSTHNRPALQEALQYCYDNNATLIVAKLDRLSRDLEFIGWLQKTEIKFVCCDMPEATRETIGFMGVMARWEREQIAKRTKEALAERKKRGVKLGYDIPKVRAGSKRYWREYKKKQKALKKKHPDKPIKPKKRPIREGDQLSKALQADLRIVPTIKVMRGQNKTFQEIAEALNKSGVPSRFGFRWHKTSVLRVADRNGLE